MKFTFTSEFVGFGSPKNTMEFEVDHIDDVINYFEQFLRGSGYHFDGHLDILNDEELTGCCGSCDNDDDTVLVPMPGTMGGAKVTFKDEDEKCTGTGLYDEKDVFKSHMRPVSSLSEKCGVRGCGLTRQQLGDHVCYDPKCGFKN